MLKYLQRLVPSPNRSRCQQRLHPQDQLPDRIRILEDILMPPRQIPHDNLEEKQVREEVLAFENKNNLVVLPEKEFKSVLQEKGDRGQVGFLEEPKE